MHDVAGGCQRRRQLLVGAIPSARHPERSPLCLGGFRSSGDRLEIEITESSLLRNTQWTHDALSQLRSAGVRISLDDFGTGYSSLSYLHNFPLQKVKIDRSFLEGIDTDRPLMLCVVWLG